MKNDMPTPKTPESFAGSLLDPTCAAGSYFCCCCCFSLLVELLQEQIHPSQIALSRSLYIYSYIDKK